MNRERLLQLIHEHGAHKIGAMVGDASAALHAAISDGWDFSTWGVKTVPGAFAFYRVRDGVITNEPRILCVNAPESERATWEQVIAESDDDGADVALLMTPMTVPF